jgi:hypothetical protein
MDHYTEQISTVRRIATEHMQRCGVDVEGMQQSFLFVGDHFVGVRFFSASVEARWLFGARLVDLLRDGANVAKVPLEARREERRAA